MKMGLNRVWTIFRNYYPSWLISRIDASTSSSVADIPLPEGPPPASAYADAGAHLTGLPQKPQTAPALPATTTYESAPVLRNLKKEATRFVPAAIHRQKKQSDAIQKIRKDAEAAGIETSKLATTSTMMVNPAPDLIDTEYEQFQQEIGDEEDEWIRVGRASMYGYDAQQWELIAQQNNVSVSSKYFATMTV